ncbi:MAG: hypothetical protein JWQ71_1888 [Pedosphaera sp.]|nr:hypothetical protein [Pedosphaera sp.]
MRTIVMSFLLLVSVGLFAGCSTTSSQADNASGTRMSGYVDTGAQKKF